MTNIITKIFGKKPATVAHVLAFNPDQEHKDLQENHKEFFEKATPEEEMQSRITPPSVKITDVTVSRSNQQEIMQAPTISSSGEILEGLELNEEFPNFVEETEEINQIDNLKNYKVYNSVEDMNNFNEIDINDENDDEEIMRDIIGPRSRPTRNDMLRSEGIIE